eukprot:EG_transcript_1635
MDHQHYTYRGYPHPLSAGPASAADVPAAALEASVAQATTALDKLEALMVGARSQVTSQRVLALNVLTSIVQEERASQERNGVVECFLTGDNRVAHLTCLRMALDDRNPSVVTAALQCLLALLSCEDELEWLLQLQPRGSLDGSPFQQLLSLHCCTQLEVVEDALLQGKAPASEEELRSLAGANTCAALLAMAVLPRLRYCLEMPPVDVHQQSLILDVLLALSIRTTLAGKAIVECPHLVPAIHAFILNPARLSDEGDPAHLALFTKAVALLAAVSLGRSEWCCAVVSPACVFNTMQALAYACHTERLYTDVRLLRLVHRALWLWGVSCCHGVEAVQPAVADAFPFLAAFVRLPFLLRSRHTDQSGEHFAPGGDVQLLREAFRVSQYALWLVACYTRTFTADARRNGEDLQAFLQSDVPALLETCAVNADTVAEDTPDSAAKEEAEAAWRTGWHVVAAAALNALRSLLPSGVTGPAVGAVLGRLWAIQRAHPHFIVPTLDQSAVPLLHALRTKEDFVRVRSPSNLLWCPPWQAHMTEAVAIGDSVAAFLHLQYDALTLHPSAWNEGIPEELPPLAASVLAQFVATLPQGLLEDPLDHAEPALFIAAHRLRLFLLHGEANAAYAAMLLVSRLAPQDAAACRLLRTAAANLSLLLQPNCRSTYHFLLSALLGDTRTFLLPFFRSFGTEVRFGPDVDPTSRSFYFSYHPAAEGTDAGGARPFQLDPFWLWRPVLGPHLRMVGLPEAEQQEMTQQMHRPLLLEWLEFMLDLEAHQSTFVAQYNPVVKTVCATNVYSAVPELIFDPAVRAALGRLVSVYVAQLLCGGGAASPGAAALPREKVARLKPHVERLLEAFASSAYGDAACGQLLLLLLHPAFPDEFQTLVLEQVSASKTAFLQVGAAFSGCGDRGFLQDIPALIPGYFALPTTNLQRIDRMAEALTVLPNQVQGPEPAVRAKFHGTLLYWHLVHHAAGWLWRPLADGRSLPSTQRNVLASIISQSERAFVVSDLCCYQPPTGTSNEVDRAPMAAALPPDRLSAVQDLCRDFPRLHTLLAAVLPT